MKLYVIRHGESETNLQQRWTGWMDVSLTEKGKMDAAKAQEILKGITFDKIYASDLCRAIQTAKIAIPGCQPETTPCLREINVGSIAGKPLDIIPPEQRKHFNEVGYGEIDGESKETFTARVKDFMKEVEALNCDTVAAFSHAGCVRTMTELVVGLPFPRGRVLCRNCVIAVYEYENGNWYLNSWINP